MEVADLDGLVGELARWQSVWLAQLRSVGRPLAIALTVVACCSLLELRFPAECGHGMRGRLRNLVHLALFQLLGLAGLALWLLHGPMVVRHAHQPTPLFAILLVVANLFTIDFVYYWYHRAQHRVPALWAIHELHHADAELNATSSFRTFWLELPVQAIVVATPSLLLFGNQGPVHALFLAIGSYGLLIFSHCNFRLRLGPLSSVVCGPQVHRIHHSRLPEHRDRNFAQYFPFLDRLFGTWHAPGQDEFPPTGVEGGLSSDASAWTALVRPFRLWAAALAPNGRAARSSKSAHERRRRHG